MLTKALLRQQYLEKRLALSTEDIQLQNDVIFDVAKSIFSKIHPDVVHIFLPHPTKNEVDTWKIIHWVWENLPKTKMVAPYVIPNEQEMEHYILGPNTKLYSNRWQIPEPDPDSSQKVDEALIEVIFIPLLAFDKKGFRVGYGGGYYDRFLEKCHSDTLKIGLSFFGPVDKIEDVETFDVPLNMCITPEYIYRF